MLTAIVLVRATRGGLVGLGPRLADVQGVAEVYTVTGEWDFVAIVRVREHEELANVVTRELTRLEGIDSFTDAGLRIAFETGQETAATLLEALDELARPEVGVNFDPANMILYGMGDPVAAARALASKIAQVHIKDAIPAPRPGDWGPRRRSPQRWRFSPPRRAATSSGRRSAPTAACSPRPDWSRTHRSRGHSYAPAVSKRPSA